MTPLKIALVGVLGIGVAASLAFADHKPNHPGGGGAVSGVWEFIGYTTTTVFGDATLPVMYDMCQIDFGDNSRMALVEELVKSPNFVLPVESSAWVHSQLGDGNTAQFTRRAGNCFGWTDTLSSGAVVGSQGDFFFESCATPRAVACVVPK